MRYNALDTTAYISLAFYIAHPCESKSVSDREKERTDYFEAALNFELSWCLKISIIDARSYKFPSRGFSPPEVTTFC